LTAAFGIGSDDAENRISGAAGFTYTYDADGNRVEKSNGTSGTLYWYMSAGIVAESDLSGNLQSEYVFFGGERVARKDFPSSAISYYFSDHLKTASVITDATGTIKSEADYYPWGGEIQFLNGDSNHYKFTGKERDAETGLDYFGARHYSNSLGRFITPDWAAKPSAIPYAILGDPQTLNLYTYVRNIPITNIDPDGHIQCPVPCHSEGQLNPPRAVPAPAPFPTFPRFIPPPPFPVLFRQSGGSTPPGTTTGSQSTPADPNQAGGTHGNNQNQQNNNQQGSDKSGNNNGKSADLTDAKAKTHILDGDSTGGGHRPSTGISGKTEFPANWSDEKILHEISDVATDPASKVTQQGKTTIFQGTRDGVDIKVVSRDGRIVTGYPTNLPKNP